MADSVEVRQRFESSSRGTFSRCRDHIVTGNDFYADQARARATEHSVTMPAIGSNVPHSLADTPQRVARTSTAAGIFDQNALFNEILPGADVQTVEDQLVGRRENPFC